MSLECAHTILHAVVTCGAFVMVAITGPLSALESRSRKAFRTSVRLAIVLAAAWLPSVLWDLWSKAWGKLILDMLPLFAVILGPLGPKTQTALVWWKRRKRRRGEVPAGVWDEVSDTYWWQRGQRRGSDGARTELEAAEAPLGCGIELEAAPQPAGRGTELEAAQQTH